MAPSAALRPCHRTATLRTHSPLPHTPRVPTLSALRILPQLLEVCGKRHQKLVQACARRSIDLKFAGSQRINLARVTSGGLSTFAHDTSSSSLNEHSSSREHSEAAPAPTPLRERHVGGALDALPESAAEDGEPSMTQGPMAARMRAWSPTKMLAA